MRVLDLYCGAGGGAKGYADAGFEVVGVDIEPQRHYPYEFVQGDAIEFCLEYGAEFDLINAGPPCQYYSPATPEMYRDRHPALIGPTRVALRATGRPYVIENVPGARKHLINPVMLCGSMFGLRVRRHRYFETWPEPIWWPPMACCHWGKAGGIFQRDDNGKRVYQSFANADVITISGHDYDPVDGRIAMGIDWMPRDKLSQAIPPAYTEWLGLQFVAMGVV